MKKQNPKTFDEAAHIVANEIADLLTMKNQDYGAGTFGEFGEMGVLIRANDKTQRLKHLLSSKKNPHYEATSDSWRDLAGYAMLAIMIRRGWFKLPLPPPMELISERRN